MATPPTADPTAPNSERSAWERLRIAATYVSTVGLAAAVAVTVARAGDFDPTGQRIVTVLFAGGALFVLLIVRRDLCPDPLSGVLTLTGITGTVVAVLITVGAIEDEPAPGCINTDGPIAATVSGFEGSAVLFSRATPASDAKGLLTRGCKLRALGYCIGASHRDALQEGINDVRWLLLSGRQGLIGAGDIAGTIPRGESAMVKCPGGLDLPDRVDVGAATIDRAQGRVSILARASRAAFIGFALALPDGTWKRLGWDRAPENDVPMIAEVPEATRGATIIAVACVGFQRPVAARDQERLQVGTVAPKDLPYVTQPTSQRPEDAACDAGIPDPAD
jgi:hypothetical protein